MVSNTATQVDVGRVIFLPHCWRVQTLESHVQNVTLLAANWQHHLAFSGSLPDMERSRAFLIRAAQLHDMAKPAHFQLEALWEHNRPKWSYSFSGHRFDAFDLAGPNPYIEALAHLHHEFSVAAITCTMATLRLDQKLEALAENFPLDLYALEMCDQIEATFARAVLGGTDPEDRVFMDFQFCPRTSGTQSCSHDYLLDPYVFPARPTSFMVEYLELHPPSDLVEEVEQKLAHTARVKDGEDRETRNRRGERAPALKRWLLAEIQSAPLQTVEVCLWPWTE